jgi:hypothetical protein
MDALVCSPADLVGLAVAVWRLAKCEQAILRDVGRKRAYEVAAAVRVALAFERAVAHRRLRAFGHAHRRDVEDRRH